MSNDETKDVSKQTNGVLTILNYHAQPFMSADNKGEFGTGRNKKSATKNKIC